MRAILLAVSLLAATGASADAPFYYRPKLRTPDVVEPFLPSLAPGGDAFPEEKEAAELAARVAACSDDLLTLELSGRTRAAEQGSWPVDGYLDEPAPAEQRRGYEASLAGRATWDRRRERFTAFALVAVGRRWGGTQFNQRGDDLAPAPLGVALTLLDGDEFAAA